MKTIFVVSPIKTEYRVTRLEKNIIINSTGSSNYVERRTFGDYVVGSTRITQPLIELWETDMEEQKIFLNSKFYFDRLDGFPSLNNRALIISERWQSDNKQYYLVNVEYHPSFKEDNEQKNMCLAECAVKNKEIDEQIAKRREESEQAREEQRIKLNEERRVAKEKEAAENRVLARKLDKKAWAYLAISIISGIISLILFYFAMNKAPIEILFAIAISMFCTVGSFEAFRDTMSETQKLKA